MALVVDDKGKKTVAGSGSNGQSSLGESIANSIVDVISDVAKNIGNDVTGGQQVGEETPSSLPSQPSSQPSSISKPASNRLPAVGTANRGYSGISGGTPVTSKSSQPQQAWSPIYSSLLDSDANGSDEPKSYWDYVQEERESRTGPENGDTETTDQQAEATSGLVPRIGADSLSSDDDHRHEPVNWNDVYERDMTDQGLSADYINSVLKETNGVSAAIDRKNGLEDKWRQDLLDPLTTSIDDGTMDRPHLLSDWMTGKQYYHYVHDLGIPGMPEDQIDISDRGRYSKTQERQVNGFQPYIPNSTYEIGMSIPNLASATRTLHDYISNLRENGFLNDVDYQMTTDTGHGVKSFSGRDFDKMSNGYASQVQDLYDRASRGDSDAMSILTSAENHSSPYTTMVRERELPDGSKHYGVVTERHDINDLVDKNVFNDLVWWGIDENTQPTYPDENGMSTYGNVRLRFDNDSNILSGTLRTKDGFDLNVEPSPDGSFQIVTDDDAFDDWWNSHNSGNQYVAFSDGSSAIVSSEDINKAMKENPNDDWIKDTLVSYDSTSLKDIDNFDPDSLTVGNPTRLGDNLYENKSEIGVMYVPDMVLSDGTPISRDVVLKIANDDNPDDSAEDGISYEFEPSGLSSKRLPFPFDVVAGSINPLLYDTDSRPRRLMHDSIVDEEGLHIGWPETFNWLADASADSIPISTPGFQFVDAFANALPYVAGVESSSGDEYGRYQTTGYDIGSDENVIKFGSTLFGPVLENLAGYGHEPHLDPMVENLIDKRFAEGTLPNLLLSKGWDSVGEAIEEVIGNYVDEPSVYGLRNAWADPISRPYAGMGGIYDKDQNLLYKVDEEGNVYDRNQNLLYADDNGVGMSGLYDDIVENHGQNGQFPVLYDEHGREFRNPDTPIGKRFANAFALTPEHLNETANAAIGGGGVSMLYSMPELMYGLGSNLVGKRNRNKNFSPEEWKIGAGDQDIESPTDEIYVPDSVKSDRISSNDYRISPGAPIKFKE